MDGHVVRLYFNKHGKRPWSVDYGPGTEERTFQHVTVSWTGTTVYRPGTGDDNTPCAWIEYQGAMVIDSGDSASIV